MDRLHYNESYPPFALLYINIMESHTAHWGPSQWPNTHTYTYTKYTLFNLILVLHKYLIFPLYYVHSHQSY